MTVTADTIKPFALLQLANAHVRRFANLIQRHDEGQRGIRIDECLHYRFIWSALADKVNNAIVKRPISGPAPAELTRADCPIELDEEERQEVGDAIDCGDYDSIVNA